MLCSSEFSKVVINFLVRKSPLDSFFSKVFFLFACSEFSFQAAMDISGHSPKTRTFKNIQGRS